MGNCIKCNNYCYDHHKYCKECYSKLIECDICGNILDPEKDEIKITHNDEILCEECYTKKQNYDIRKNYIAEYRAKDGHYVRSKSELTIDNYLYDNRIVHAYEKKIFSKTNPENEYLSDFYLPEYDLYIEHWGIENNQEYINKKSEKQNIYLENNYKLLNIYEENIKNLDDYLDKELLKYKRTKTN